MWLCTKKRILMNFLFCFLMEVTMAEDESWLVFITGMPTINIWPLSKNGTNKTQIPAHDSPRAFTFGWEEKKIYWSTSFGRSPVLRANIDGTSLENVLELPELQDEFTTGLALDWITKNLYLVLGVVHESHIRVCDLSGQLCSVLVRDPKYSPFRIALHPQSGTMVWTNTGIIDAICKASMDGSNPMQITAKEYGNIISIFIDHALSRLYWVNSSTETVFTSDLDGGNASTLKSIGNTTIQAVGLAVTGSDIYWVDAKEHIIKKCNKNDGSLFKTDNRGLRGSGSVFSTYEFDMFVMSSGSQPNNRVNHCANHSCPHICVLTETSSRCLCPDYFALSQDGQHCEDVGPQMIISSSGGTHVLSIATREMTTISNSSPSWGLSYDFQNSKIYWAGGKNGSTIFRSNLNGSDIESVVTVSGQTAVTGLAYDWIAHNIYYTGGDLVGVCDSSGTNCAVLLHTSSNSPSGILLFPRYGRMVWNAYGQSNSINRAHMDGSSTEVLDIRTHLRSFVHDDSQQLYRLFNQTIIFSDLDFNLRYTHVPWVEELKSIAVGDKNVYWTNNKKIQRCKKYNHCWSTQTVKEFNWNETVFEMTLIHRKGQLQDRINHCAGGLCSHICLLTQKYFRCICPTGMYLREDARTCKALERHELFGNITFKDVVSSYKPIILKPDDDNGGRFEIHGSLRKWMCAGRTFVDLADLCNGTLGCPDGTDEGQYCDIPCSKINRTDDEKNCMRTPNGPQVVCPQGFQPAPGGAMCEDIDECLENVCENYCVNTNGSFECRELPEGSGEVEGCGGMIVANSGTLQLDPSSTPCLWVIALQNTTGVHLEVSRFMSNPILVIPQQKVSNHNLQSVWINGSTDDVHKFEGNTLAIVVPNRTEKFHIRWKGLEGDISGASFSTKFVNAPEDGTLEWKHEREGRNKIFWAFNFGTSVKFSWSLDTVLPACDPADPCESIYLTVLEIIPDGVINEIQRTCEGSSELSFKVEKGSQVLVILHMNAPVEATTSFGVTWIHDEYFQTNVEGLIA